MFPATCSPCCCGPSDVQAMPGRGARLARWAGAAAILLPSAQALLLAPAPVYRAPILSSLRGSGGPVCAARGSTQARAAPTAAVVGKSLAPTLAALLLLAAPAAWADDGGELAPPVLDQVLRSTARCAARVRQRGSERVSGRLGTRAQGVRVVGVCSARRHACVSPRASASCAGRRGARF